MPVGSGKIRRHNTEIEWTHPPGFLGETWNPTSGCTKVSPGCAHCYADQMNRRFKRSPPFLPGQYRIDLHDDRLDFPLRWALPRCIFVDSMADLFHEDVPFDFIDRVMAVVLLRQDHIFQVLTKRPEIMLHYFASEPLERIKIAVYGFQGVAAGRSGPPWSVRIKRLMSEPIMYPFPNLWLGTSVENQEWANRRMGDLLRIPAAIHFVSVEPLLGSVDFKEVQHSGKHDVTINAYTGEWLYRDGIGRLQSGRIDWVITGGESGPRVRVPHPQWFRQLRDDCLDYGIPFFFKQWGTYGVVQEPVPMMKIKNNITYARLDPHDRNRDRANLLIDSDVPMRRMGKTVAGALLDSVPHKAFPDLSYFERAMAIDNGAVQTIHDLDKRYLRDRGEKQNGPVSDESYAFTRANGGFLYHVRRHSPQGQVLELAALCGFRPSSPKGHIITGRGGWNSPIHRDRQNRRICPTCAIRLEKAE